MPVNVVLKNPNSIREREKKGEKTGGKLQICEMIISFISKIKLLKPFHVMIIKCNKLKFSIRISSLVVLMIAPITWL